MSDVDRYDVGLVTRVLPQVLHGAHAYGYQLAEGTRERGMPPSPSDPAHYGLAWAVAADLQRAFRWALTADQRDCVWVRMVLDQTWAVTAGRCGVSVSQARVLVDAGLTGMCAWLNGDWDV